MDTFIPSPPSLLLSLSPAFPSACDSQEAPSLPSPPSLPCCHADAALLEEQYVHRVYDAIASHFSSTRHSPWPRVCHFLSSLPPGSVLADVGCGNGKYLGVNPEVIAVSVIIILTYSVGKCPFPLSFYCYCFLDYSHCKMPQSFISHLCTETCNNCRSWFALSQQIGCSGDGKGTR